jgi:MFS transporter, MHS family, shikimate and dehydroshikimate transport protein
VALWVRLRVEESPIFQELKRSQKVVRLPIRDAITRYPRSFLVGVGAHVCDTAIYYIYATFTVSYLTGELDMPRSTVLTGVVLYGLVLILLQPIFGALSDRIGRKPVNVFSVLFTAAFAFPYFLLLNTGEPVLVWLGMVVATALGLAPMIAVQPAFYAELFGSRVRYSGFAASRELGAALVGFSPLISAALVGALDGDPWLVAGWMIFTAAISLVAFLYSAETRDIDISEADPVQGRIVRAANVREVGPFRAEPR